MQLSFHVIDKNSGVLADIQLLLFHFYSIRGRQKKVAKNPRKKSTA